MRCLRSNGRATWWILPLAVLVVALLPLTPLAAQDSGDQEGASSDQAGQEATAGDDETAAADEGLPADLAEGDEDLPDIDAILQGDEEVLGGGGQTYDPGDRRDPFRSLLEARRSNEPEGPRPEGIPGLLIDEVIVSGIFQTAQGWVAQVQVSENDKSFLLRVGDQLYDGDVVSISENEVVFSKIVQDPTALKPFREVTKKLNP